MLRSNQQTPEVDRVLVFLTSYIQAASLAVEFEWKLSSESSSAVAHVAPAENPAIQASVEAMTVKGDVETEPVLHIDFNGPDVPLLLDRRAELLNALEHLAAKLFGLAPEQHHRIRLDAGNHKADRDRELDASFTDAIAEVQRTGHAFRFDPMNSRERRMLHLQAAAAGLRSASAGEGPMRSVTISPLTPVAAPARLSASTALPQGTVTPERAAKLREAFRRR